MDSLLAVNALASSLCPISTTPPASLMSLKLLIPFFLLATLAVTSTRKASKQSGQLPKVRYGWPVVGNVIAYSKNPISFLRKATAQYGTTFRTDMIFTSVIWLRSPQLNKIYLETKEVRSSCSPITFVNQPKIEYLVIWRWHSTTCDPLEETLGETDHFQGFFLNKIVSPGYFDNLKAFVGSLSRGINRTVALDHYSRLARETSRTFLIDWAQKDELHLFEHVSRLVHAIIVQCLMGPDFYAENGEELYSLLHDMEADIGSVCNFILPEWVPHPAALRLRRQRDRVGAIFQERLEERRLHPERWTDSPDYISYTCNDSVTAHLSHYYSSHHTMLMFAAHTSTVASISWTILELLKSPDRLASLRHDLDQVSDHRSSPYLQACLKETVRRYSGISMFRHARQSTLCPGTETAVPKGAVISISSYLTHRDPSIYPDAEAWIPERWLREPDLAKRLNSGDQLAYIPFGAGAHRCPGEKMAGLIGAAVVGTLVQDYDVAWGQKKKADLTELDFSKVGSPWLKGDAGVFVRRREL
ncbi:MAG: hypothetical protein Q9223_002512 [Gallowayella weberi]